MKPVMKGVAPSSAVERPPDGEGVRGRRRVDQDIDADAARLKSLLRDGGGGKEGELQSRFSKSASRFSKSALRAPGGMARASGSMLKGIKSNAAGVKSVSPQTRALPPAGERAFASRSAGGAAVSVSQERSGQASQASQASSFEGSEAPVSSSSSSSSSSPSSSLSSSSSSSTAASADSGAPPAGAGVGAEGSVAGDSARRALRHDGEASSSPVAVEHVSASASPSEVSSQGAGAVSDAPPLSDSSSMSVHVQEVATRILVGQPQASGGQEVRITVNQEVLPGTEVRMREMHGMLTVELVTTSPQSHAVLAGQSDALRAWLGNATRLNVDVRLAYSGGQSDGDAAGGRSRGRFRFQDEENQP